LSRPRDAMRKKQKRKAASTLGASSGGADEHGMMNA
jgi:hypothetical protein